MTGPAIQDLLTAIEAAIAEDERLVNEIGSAVRSWYADGGGDVWRRGEPPAYAPFVAGQGEVGRHIARHDPARVLRQAQAHRRILELHYRILRDIGWLEWDDGEFAECGAELPVCGTCVPRHSSYPSRDDVPLWPCPTVRALADAYGIEVDGS